MELEDAFAFMRDPDTAMTESLRSPRVLGKRGLEDADAAERETREREATSPKRRRGNVEGVDEALEKMLSPKSSAESGPPPSAEDLMREGSPDNVSSDNWDPEDDRPDAGKPEAALPVPEEHRPGVQLDLDNEEVREQVKEGLRQWLEELIEAGEDVGSGMAMTMAAWYRLTYGM